MTEFHTLTARVMIYPGALLQFAKGKLIKTEEDLNWLKIHGANMYGIKSDFKTRIQWVNENII